MIPPDPKSLMKEGQENLPKVEQMGTMTLEELHEYHCNNPDRRMLCMFGTLKGGQHEEGDPPAAATFVRSLAGIVTRAHATQTFGITDRLFSPSIFPLSKNRRAQTRRQSIRRHERRQKLRSRRYVHASRSHFVESERE